MTLTHISRFCGSCLQNSKPRSRPQTGRCSKYKHYFKKYCDTKLIYQFSTCGTRTTNTSTPSSAALHCCCCVYWYTHKKVFLHFPSVLSRQHECSYVYEGLRVTVFLPHSLCKAGFKDKSRVLSQSPLNRYLVRTNTVRCTAV